ncbi:MAG: DUF2115 family protein [Methanobrevibacter wolinii]|nr:DUF2115 family protein [Methanobrevibacter wolinii]
MKASSLLNEIRENLANYPIDYLKNKAKDDRYPDSITKRLAIYNSKIYDEIFNLELETDFNIKDNIVSNLKNDIDYYFSVYDPYNEDIEFTKNLCLYLVFIGKKPLHPYSDDSKNYDVFIKNNKFYCKNRIKYIKDKNSLCRYCVCRNLSFLSFM